MKALSRLFRVRFASIILAFSVLISSASAQETPTPWQDVITSQVQAFRDHDAAAALSFAGAGFQTRFSSPEEFFVTIMGSGYAPIVESRSHSFGAFMMVDDKTVAQRVTFSGADQRLYEAVYVLVEETVGWRVQGVQLTHTAAVGI
jgi:hypothetical protein